MAVPLAPPETSESLKNRPVSIGLLAGAIGLAAIVAWWLFQEIRKTEDALNALRQDGAKAHEEFKTDIANVTGSIDLLNYRLDHPQPTAAAGQNSAAKP